MDAEINDSPGTLITKSAAIFRFQYNTQTSSHSVLSVSFEVAGWGKDVGGWENEH